jgi:hypothetical protein
MQCRTPELIWSDDMVLTFRSAITEQVERLYTLQMADATALMELDEEFEVEYETLDDEIYIGGIYVRLFLQNPNYKIRRPETFIEALLQAHEGLAPVDGMEKDLGYICTCIITVLKVRRYRASWRAQATLTRFMPGAGSCDAL